MTIVYYQSKVVVFTSFGLSSALCIKVVCIANNMDPDQTAVQGRIKGFLKGGSYT